MNFQLETIKRKRDFEKLFASGKRFSIGSLRLVVLQKEQSGEQSELNKVYYAVQVSKKATKRAVVRNRIKRLLRESLRYLAKTAMKDKLHIFQYIFLGWVDAPSRPCEIHLKDVLPLVERGLNLAYLSIVEKPEGEKWSTSLFSWLNFIKCLFRRFSRLVVVSILLVPITQSRHSKNTAQSRDCGSRFDELLGAIHCILVAMTPFHKNLRWIYG